MQGNERAGQPASQADLVDVAALVTAYYAEHPDPAEPGQQVSFGTSGHRGSAFRLSFNDDHIAATTQAICEYRARAGITGPLFIGRDTHALSEPAFVTALEVLDRQRRAGADRQPGRLHPDARRCLARSWSTTRSGRRGGLADGIVVTPSHNPPEDGGFKYNPPDGGPAATQITSVIQDRANELLRGGLREVRRIRFDRARAAAGRYDFLGAYVSELPAVVDTDAIRTAGVRIGADPLGGASVAYWGEIAERFGLDLTVVNPVVDATFRFMTLDWDGRIRMDCSSPYAMASLIARRTEFAVATGNDTDADRHGIVTPDAGLMNPNHYLAAAIDYLYRHREDWPADAAVGKTMVSSVDHRPGGRRRRAPPDGGAGRVQVVRARPAGRQRRVRRRGERRRLVPAPGRPGLDHRQGRDHPGPARLRDHRGHRPHAVRALPRAHRAARRPGLRPDRRPGQPRAEGGPGAAQPGPGHRDRAGRRADPRRLTTAPGNGEPLGGLKVVTESGWFAARPSGTEDVYKLYAESFRGPEHLARIQAEAQQIIEAVL